jgi:hypothetical protein
MATKKKKSETQRLDPLGILIPFKALKAGSSALTAIVFDHAASQTSALLFD